MYPSTAFPGRGVFVQEQVRGLRQLGADVRVIFFDRWSQGPTVYYRMGSQIAQAVQEFKPDLIHAMYGGVMAQQLVMQRLNLPLFITFHGSDLLGENLSGWARKLISGYGVRCSRKAAKAAQGIVVVARHLLKALPRALEAARICVLPCGIDLERFKPMDSQCCRRQLGWDEEAFHVLFASSNGDPVKQPWLAQAAVDQAVAGGLRAELHYMTGVPNAVVPIWLNASHALLLTSLHEGSPTIVKEALACALPVVSVEVGDVAERIESIEGCHLVRPEAADLANGLCRVHARRERLNCRAELEALSITSVAQRLKEFYARAA